MGARSRAGLAARIALSLAGCGLAALGAPREAHAQAQEAAAPAVRARIATADGEVLVGAGSARRAAAAGDELATGARVATRNGGAAELALEGGARLHLASGVTLVLFANPLPPRPGARPSTNTTLLHGTLRATVPDGARLAIDTPSGATVTLLPGESVVNVDSSRVVRVAVYRGRARVRSGDREPVVRAGSALRVDPRFPVQLPRPLLAAPAWLAPPPARVYGRGEPVAVAGELAPAPRAARATPGAPRVVSLRMQVARDAGFTEVVSDRVVPARHTRFEASALPPGSYYARAIAIDGDRIEGTPGPAAPIVVAAPRVIPASRGRRAALEIPAGLACGLNGEPESEQPVPIPLASGRHHVVRCAGTPDGGGPFELAVPADQTGPLRHEIALDAGGFTPAGGSRLLALRLTDAAGLPVSYATVRVTASDGAVVDTLRESDVRGVYTGTLAWRAGTPGVRLRFTVNDAAHFDAVLGRP